MTAATAHAMKGLLPGESVYVAAASRAESVTVMRSAHSYALRMAVRVSTRLVLGIRPADPDAGVVRLVEITLLE